MSDLDYDALRKVAEAAEGDGIYPDTWWGQPGARPLDVNETDAAYFAAFEPRVILALLDLAQRAEADRAAIKMLHAKYAGRSKWVGYEKPRREAWAEIESDLRAALDPKEDQ